MPRKLISVTLVSDTSILADGDVICATAEVPQALPGPGQAAELDTVILHDEDDQGVALDLVFFNANVSLGTVNGAPNINDANSRAYLGHVSIGTSDYVDLTANRVAVLRNIGMIVGGSEGSIYVSAITRGGTPTYSASGLKLKLGFKL